MTLKMELRAGALLLFAAVFPGSSRAQYSPPKVELDLAASAVKYPHLEIDDVAVADCSGISRAAGTVRSEEIGTIRVLAYAPWYQTAEHLAKEKAGEAGANCLLMQYSAGLEGVPVSYPFQASYRAYRLTRLNGFGSTSFSTPIRADALLAAGQAAQDSSAPQARLTPGPAGHEHLWTSGNFIYRYEIGMDTTKFPKETWEDIARDFKEYFPPSEYEQLLLARRGKAKVLVDFKNMRIRRDP
jgi:hypothetical protein